MDDLQTEFDDVLARRLTFTGDSRADEALGLLENMRQVERVARRMLSPQIFEESFGREGHPDWTTNTGNLAAFDGIRFRPRVAAGVGQRTLSTTVLGTPVSSPVLLAPVGICGRFDEEAEVASGRAAANAGSIAIVSFNANAGVDEVAAVAPGRTWYQLYFMKDRGLNLAMIQLAEAVGATALVVTIDNPGFYSKERVSRKAMMSRSFRNISGFELPTTQTMNTFQDQSLSWSDLALLREQTRLPIVVKGIQSGEDARIAAELGFDALVVSNHGGHMLQGARASIDVLPEVVDSVEGRLEVYLDSGIRQGNDVLKALALGARAVLIGRAMAWGLTIGSNRGVERVLAILAKELDMAMGLCGLRDVADASPALVEL
ncbi:alpha-hydroxy acid oxidase [soil metagenome]